MNTFPETKNRFISYFDIMGFKDYVYRHSHDEVSKLMDEVAQTVSMIKYSENKILDTPISEREQNSLQSKAALPVVFSDSILFISESDSIEDLRKILFITSYFLYEMIKKSVPIKGSISHGLFTADFDKSRFFGQPLIDAYLLADEVHFYGSVIHNSAEVLLKQYGIDSYICNKGYTPMKIGNVKHYFSNWLDIMESSDKDQKADNLLEKFYDNSSGGVRKYVDNSFKIYCQDS